MILFLPPPPGFEQYDAFIYSVALKEIKNEEQYQAYVTEQQRKQQERKKALEGRMEEVTAFCTQIATDYTEGKLNDQLTETNSGLKYIIHEEGTGAVPKAGEPVSVHYYGMLTDGSMFDNSYSKGSPISFPVGRRQVIEGWDEGLTTFKRGTKGTLFIPYELAYGEEGRPPRIPAKSELIFYVELLEKVEE